LPRVDEVIDVLTALALEAAFDGGRLVSDGGLTSPARVDTERAPASRWPRSCPNGVQQAGPSLMKFVKQRVFQIACDYEHRAKPMFIRCRTAREQR
jgi:hypothetical protein